LGSGKIGKTIGSSVGSTFSKITGLGDYTISKNSLLNG
jgi:hypothetical protein